MKYEKELDFVKNLLHNFNLSFFLMKEPFDLPPMPSDFGLRKLIIPDFDYMAVVQRISQICEPNTIYRTQDPFLCYYILFRIPNEEEPVFAAIGPYTLMAMTHETLVNYPFKIPIPPEIIPQLEKFYQEIPFIADESILYTLLCTLGEKIWGNFNNFSLKEIPDTLMEDLNSLINEKKPREEQPPFLSMKVLEERYSVENALMQAVAAGQTNKAEMLLIQLTSRKMEQRLADPLRDQKNYTIILNTLLRKAAEQGDVHPLHIDSISSRFARKIELCATIKALESLRKEMVHRYCLLVQNHSLKGYSLLVREVLIRIDTDLTADLSLYAQAKLLNVNSSYLSTLFKKETGITLTEYVNKKRIKYAVFLLNTTGLQIQMIAQHCGIPDVNYFIKTFKKYIGKTPKEYRDSVNSKNPLLQN